MNENLNTGNLQENCMDVNQCTIENVEPESNANEAAYDTPYAEAVDKSAELSRELEGKVNSVSHDLDAIDGFNSNELSTETIETPKHTWSTAQKVTAIALATVLTGAAVVAVHDVYVEKKKKQDGWTRKAYRKIFKKNKPTKSDAEVEVVEKKSA